MLKKIINKLSGIFKKSNNNKELYIGNINYHVKPFELRKLFEEFGDIESIKIIRDPKTRRSKGYGFVKFYCQKDASKAIKNTNSKVFKGRELCVDFAKEQ